MYSELPLLRFDYLSGFAIALMSAVPTKLNLRILLARQDVKLVAQAVSDEAQGKMVTQGSCARDQLRQYRIQMNKTWRAP